MQRYTIFFITVNALHVLGGFSAHHQELKNCTHNIGYTPSVRKVSVLIFYLSIYWTYLKVQVISFKV